MPARQVPGVSPIKNKSRCFSRLPDGELCFGHVSGEGHLVICLHWVRKMRGEGALPELQNFIRTELQMKSATIYKTVLCSSPVPPRGRLVAGCFSIPRGVVFLHRSRRLFLFSWSRPCCLFAGPAGCFRFYPSGTLPLEIHPQALLSRNIVSIGCF
jgi:hypothetical protein